jgi:hypothetical protein
MDQAERLKLAGELIANADAVAQRVAESVERFRAYDNSAESFCPKHKPLKAPAAITGGRSLAAALARGPNIVSGDIRFSFTLVDYEVPPSRTTIKAPQMLNRFEDGSPSTATMAIDLLLRHEDGTPIIGEVKFASAKKYDTNAVLALVQALAGAAQFATPNQQQRLTKCYPSAFTAATHVDVAVVSYRPALPAPAKYQKQLDAAASALAKHLKESPNFPPDLRQVYFIRASGSPIALSFDSS